MPDFDIDAIERLAKPMRKIRDYCRITVEGLENIPPGPAILVSNHTGWAGLDYSNLFLTIYDGTKRIPRVAVHPSYFHFPRIRQEATKLGFYEVSVTESTRILDEGGLVTFFPEGEAGNFKPIWKRYQLQEFKPGFARVALATMAPIIPIAIVGGEDANPSLGTIHLNNLDMPIPLPLSLLPLPAKWRIKICPPIDPANYLHTDSPDKDHAPHIAENIRQQLQTEVNNQRTARGHIFF